jgi:hypothetical protein
MRETGSDSSQLRPVEPRVPDLDLPVLTGREERAWTLGIARVWRENGQTRRPRKERSTSAFIRHDGDVFDRRKLCRD